MDSIDEARKKEAREGLMMLPVALLFLIALAGVYLVLLSEEVEFFGVIYWGFAKDLWFFSLILIGGLGVFFLVLSVSFLIFVALVAKELSAKQHPWKPLIISSLLLIMGFWILKAAVYFNSYLSGNVRNINMFFESYSGGMEAFIDIAGIILLLVSLFLSSFIYSLILLAVKLPGCAKGFANKARANR
ncbi:hypothetical protein QP938_01305 [Porticoccaceae bacterium LTM1]|nr:hypothetical protein QP938_01305 [Porticoccaceae bacterium LTM1]